MNTPTTGKCGDRLPKDNRSGVLLPLKLSSLRTKLGQKAKQEVSYKFYTLMGQVCLDETLRTAWQMVKGNGGSAGVDGVEIWEVESQHDGANSLLKEIKEELLNRTYKPKAVRRVYIPKSNGKLRPLGIPTVKDRVVQTAVLLILEPIFEADFLDCSYGFRPSKSAHQALEELRKQLRSGYHFIYDADLKGYFDSIPHDRLMKCLEVRISDRSILKIIRSWLKAPVKDEGKEDKTLIKTTKGTPQGGVISPLLANIYLHWFDIKFHRTNGPLGTCYAKLIRYADDFVVLTKWRSLSVEKWIEGTIEGWLGLEINREKTKVINLKETGSKLDFLGYTYKWDKGLDGRKGRYLNLIPSDKSLQREKDNIRNLFGVDHCYKKLETLIAELNRQTRGWKEYFKLGYPRVAYKKLNWYIENKVHDHMNRRSQRGYKIPAGKSFYSFLRAKGFQYLKVD